MPHFPSDTPEAAALRVWLEDTVLADYDYRPELIGDPLLLFKRDYRGTFMMALMDGLPAKSPDWADGQCPSDVFFRALASYLSEVPSHLAQILGHDGAYWEVRRVVRATSDRRYLPYILDLLHREPADESGATYIMLLADDRRSAVVLADNPYLIPPYVGMFCIVFHGGADRRELFLNYLRNATSGSQPPAQ